MQNALTAAATWGSESSDVAVPAVSGWGAILMVALLLAAWWVFGRKRKPSPTGKGDAPDS